MNHRYRQTPPVRQRHMPLMSPVQLQNLAAATLLSLLTFSPAMADDTEVFFGQVDSTSNTRPNVLFVLDTSGSMNENDVDDNGNELEGTRLERMRQAMQTILDSSSNINVGLMRFNGRQYTNQSKGGGGSVIFPMTPIDEVYCDGGECPPINLELSLAAGTDDLQEITDTGTTDINSASLALGHNEDSARMTGLHFAGLNVPQGATIVSASLEFLASSDSPQNASVLSIAAERSDDAPVFAETANELSNRTLTDNPVSWSPGFWLAGERYQSADISSVVQQVVERPGWCGGSALALIVSGSGQRNAQATDGAAPGDAPILRVSYKPSGKITASGCQRQRMIRTVDASSSDAQMSNGKGGAKGAMDVRGQQLTVPESGGDEQRAGIRFNQINLPAQTTIKTAHIEMVIAQSGSGSSDIGIYLEAANDPADYSTTRYDLYDPAGGSDTRSYHSPVIWSAVPDAAPGTVVRSPDIAGLIQTAVDRSGWDSGNSIAFMLAGENGTTGIRHFTSWDREATSAPTLVIVYEGKQDGDVQTARQHLSQTIDSIRAIGATPIVDTYLEAAQYYRGGNVRFGLTRGPNGATQGFHRVSHPDSYTGTASVNTPSGCTADNYNSSICADERITGTPQYISPLASSCQTNHIVFLSDGEASSNTVQGDVPSRTGRDKCRNKENPDDMCGEELAEWLYNTDHNEVLAGKQNISTYTIGFNLDDSKTGLLKTMAERGNGKYYPARSASELTKAFRSIIGTVSSEETSFVAPGATVNQFNRLEHRDDIYFAQFKPAQQPLWAGNVKRYQASTDPVSRELLILDSNGNPAVDSATGFFSSTARSFWLDANTPADGKQVDAGGAASQLDLTDIPGIGDRRVYTLSSDTGNLPIGGADLTLADHALGEQNTRLTDAMLGIEGKYIDPTEQSQFRTRLLQWARGVDILDHDGDGDRSDARHQMGDPMHSRPVILNYSTAGEDKSILFLGTNEGFLHAINTADGHEQYAFIPPELLPNLQIFFDNDSTSRPYGLDGQITLWSDDSNDNLRVDAGEKAMLFVGMRRGGRHYYALDVSDPASPRLAWTIEGGTGDFAELGESWSAATPTAINFEGQRRDVLIFGGGYDTNQDPDTSLLELFQTQDGVGRAIFIVDLHTGELLWSAQKTGGNQQFENLNYSIPSSIRVVDIDFDGLADQLYVGDTGAQLWRFDITPAHQSGDLLRGGVMARLNGLLSRDHRRFYYEPSVALVADRGKRSLAISLGSGWRAHPLDKTVDDRFYVIRSDAINGAPEHYGIPVSSLSDTYRPLTEDDLTDVTDGQTADLESYGWFLRLEAPGEKVLGNAVTFDNKVLFSTYRPALNVRACSTAIGGGVAYSLNVLSGAASDDLDGDGDIDQNDRSEELQHGGIPPNPNILIIDGEAKVAFGAEPGLTSFGNQTHRTFWVDQRDAGTTITATTENTTQ